MVAPSDAPGQVAAILSRIPVVAERAADGAAIERLASLTNRNYKVSLGPETFVVRIAGTGTERYIDRVSEARNARLAASIGVAPDVVYCDPSAGVMVTRFIANGVPLQAPDLRQPGNIRRAGLLLMRLHGSGLAFAGRMDLFPKLDQYLLLIAERGWPKDLDLTHVRAQATAAQLALERRPTSKVPSHVDPVADNFVAGHEAFYLIDWEYSAMAEPMWDLAGLAIEAALDAGQERLLLETCLRDVAPQDAARFLLYKASLLLLAAAWAVLQAVDGNPNADFRAFALERLQRHLDLRDSAAYRDSLAALAS